MAIARTVLRNPPVLILDEATSALGHRDRARGPAGAGRALAGPHDDRDRPPPLDDPRLRPDPGARLPAGSSSAAPTSELLEQGGRYAALLSGARGRRGPDRRLGRGAGLSCGSDRAATPRRRCSAARSRPSPAPPPPSSTASRNGSRSSSGRRWTCGPRITLARNSRGCSGCWGAGCKPALRGGEAGREQALARGLGGRVVPGRAPVAEVLGVWLAGQHGVRDPAQAVDVALSPALGDELAAGAQRGVQAAKQRVVVEHPVEGRGREDRVHRLRRAPAPAGPSGGSPPARARRIAWRACSIIDGEASTAITRPRGRRSSSASVTRPDPQPASSTVSSPRRPMPASTARPSASWGAEMRS